MALDGDPNEPLLSSGPPIVMDDDDEGETEFSRLIAQSHTIDEHLHILDFQRLIPEELSMSLNLDDGRRTSRVIVDDKPRGPFVTAVAGSLCLIHLGLVWGSYTAQTWSQTHVSFTVGWQMDYLSFLDQFTDQVIRATSLASFLQDLDECNAYLLLVFTWSTALVVPCLFMVVSPTLVVGDYIRSIELQKRRISFDGRSFLELVTRFAWLPIFSMSFVSLATSFIQLEWTGTVIHLGLKTMNPFAAYLVGTLCGVGMLALLRVPRTESFRIVADSEVEIEFSPTTPSAIRSPPPQAFRHPWHVEDESENVIQDADEPVMTVLEEDALLSPTPPRPNRTPSRPRNMRITNTSGNSTPELVDEDMLRPPAPHSPSGLTYWNKFSVFQLGLLSVVLWIPANYLPLLHFSYNGVASDFIKERSFRLYLWEVPSYLWTQGVEFGTPGWIVLLLGVFTLTAVLILPIIATFQGVLAWLGEGAWKIRSYVWLYVLQPCLGGLVFSLALVSTVPVLPRLSVLLLDEHASQICHGLTDNPCLEIKAQMLSGAFFFVVQAICLEAFVLLTLRWSRRH